MRALHISLMECHCMWWVHVPVLVEANTWKEEEMLLVEVLGNRSVTSAEANLIHDKIGLSTEEEHE